MCQCCWKPELMLWMKGHTNMEWGKEEKELSDEMHWTYWCKLILFLKMCICMCINMCMSYFILILHLPWVTASFSIVLVSKTIHK